MPSPYPTRYMPIDFDGADRIQRGTDPLHHRPGDTFVIGGKPSDPTDPGPWAWFPRSVRHRPP